MAYSLSKWESLGSFTNDKTEANSSKASFLFPVWHSKEVSTNGEPNLVSQLKVWHEIPLQFTFYHLPFFHAISFSGSCITNEFRFEVRNNHYFVDFKYNLTFVSQCTCGFLGPENITYNEWEGALWRQRDPRSNSDFLSHIYIMDSLPVRERSSYLPLWILMITWENLQKSRTFDIHMLATGQLLFLPLLLLLFIQ